MSKLDQFRNERDKRQAQAPFGKIDAGKLAQLAAMAGDAGMIAGDGEFMVRGVRLTQVGAEIPAELSADDLQAVLRIIAQLEGSLAWIAGDLLVYGETRKYGDAKAWAEWFDRAPGTVYNWMSVCRRFPKNSRRRELSFHHHTIVQGFDNAEELLELAVLQGLSAAQLRNLVAPKALPGGWEPIVDAFETRMMNLVRKGADHRGLALRVRMLADKLERGG